jgi:hypothetical protein
MEEARTVGACSYAGWHHLKVAFMAKRWDEMKSLAMVLRYQKKQAARATVSIPLRCDMEDCQFYRGALEWRGKSLPLILDHTNGNNSDNSPDNLRYLCPNCDSQLETRGGRNRGRVEKSDGGYAIVSRGKREYFLPAEPGHYSIKGHKPKLRFTREGVEVNSPDDQRPKRPKQ